MNYNYLFMVKYTKRIWKIFRIIIITIGLTLFFTILFISPIAKFLIEKYDVEIIGRQITLDWVIVNPFSGSIQLNGLSVFENKSDELFLSADELLVDFSLVKLIHGEYEITELNINQLIGNVIKNDSLFNFDDIIDRFKTDTIESKAKEPIHFSILNIQIKKSQLIYRDLLTPVHYSIKELSMESPGFHWNEQTIQSTFSFISGESKGNMNGAFTINYDKLDYLLDIKIEDFDLLILEQYLSALTNYGNYSAMLEANLRVTGNFKMAENVSFIGDIALNDFHFGKDIQNDYASFKKLSLSIDELSPLKKVYLFDSVILDTPYFKFERYDYLDNLQYMFADEKLVEKKVNSEEFNLVITIGNYIRDLSMNFLKSNYRVNKLLIENGNLKFNDYSINEKFSIGIEPLTVEADSVNKKNKVVKIDFKSGIKPFGSSVVSLEINPRDSSDFRLHYAIDHLPISLFNPYFVSYTSYPFDRGTLSLNGNWNVNNGKIVSNNHLLLIDPRISKRIKRNSVSKIPLPIIMAFIKERGNVIDYEIPITGNLNTPSYDFWDVIFDLIGNVFIKPATTPYRIKVRNAESEIENSMSIKWALTVTEINKSEKKFIRHLSHFLKDNPSIKIRIRPMIYTDKENEYLLLYKAKKMFYLSNKQMTKDLFSESDSFTVDKINSKDSLFVQYLKSHIHKKKIHTVQEMCSLLISPQVLQSDFSKMNRRRKKVFLEQFQQDEVMNQIEFLNDKSVIPYNGYSYYEIDFKGELPLTLVEAYKHIRNVDDEKPRINYLKDRISIKKILKVNKSK